MADGGRETFDAGRLARSARGGGHAVADRRGPVRRLFVITVSRPVLSTSS
jgi:hypothetical protein